MLLGVHGARASIGQRFRQFGEFFIPVRQVGHARYRCRLLVDALRSRLGLVSGRPKPHFAQRRDARKVIH